MADDKDYIKGWSAQQGAAPEAPYTVPGNVFVPEELPSKDALVAAGVDLDQYHAGLVVAVDEHERALLRGEAVAEEAPGKVTKAKAEPKAAPEAE